ncbi:MAG: anti-sigma factor family protein [Actinomycetota bacterium]
MRELTCKELVELVTDHLEGALSRRDRKRFERHIGACDGCTAYLEQMRVTIRLTGELVEEDLSEPARAELLEAFRSWSSSG